MPAHARGTRVHRRLRRHAAGAARAARLPPAARRRQRRPDDPHLQPGAAQQPHLRQARRAVAGRRRQRRAALGAAAVRAGRDRRRPAGRQRAAAGQRRARRMGAARRSGRHRPAHARQSRSRRPDDRAAPSTTHPLRIAVRAGLPHHAYSSLRPAPVVLAVPPRRHRPRGRVHELLAGVDAEPSSSRAKSSSSRSTATAASRSGPPLETVHDAASPAVWRLLVDANDTLWAGTGNDGQVWKIDRDGKARSPTTRPSSRCTRSRRARRRHLRGLVARRQGLPHRRATAPPRPSSIPTTSTSGAWPSAPTRTSTSAPARRAASTRSAPTARARCSTTPKRRTSPRWRGIRAGSLLVGTSSPGRVLRIDPAGQAFVLLESAYKEIRGLRVAPDGQIYVTAVGVASGGADAAAGQERARRDADVGGRSHRLDRDHRLGHRRHHGRHAVDERHRHRHRAAAAAAEGRGLSHRARRRLDDGVGIAGRHPLRRRRRAVRLAAGGDRRQGQDLSASRAIRR